MIKNAIPYRIHGDDLASCPAEFIEQALAAAASRPLGGSEGRRAGWVSPLGRRGTTMLLEASGHRFVTALFQERLLPTSVVSEEVAERSQALEDREGRALSRRERLAIKEQVIEELLPRAFIKSRRVSAYWDLKRSRITVDATSRKDAEALLDLLRQSLGSLKVTPLATAVLPMRALTEWLSHPEKRPEGVTIGDVVELKAKGDDGVVRGKNVDLDSDDMQELLAVGRQASKLALSIEGLASFVANDDNSLRSIRIDDTLLDELAQAEGDDPLALLQADLVLSADTLGAVQDRLIAAMGGEA